MAKLLRRDPVHKCRLFGSRALGVTMQLPTDDRHNYSKSFCTTRWQFSWVAESRRNWYSNRSRPVPATIWSARRPLRAKWFCEWGMSEKLGPLVFGQKEESMFLGRSFGSKRDVSSEMALEIDREIKRLVTENYERAKRVLGEQMTSLKALAEALLEKEVLNAMEIDGIILRSSSHTVLAESSAL